MNLSDSPASLASPSRASSWAGHPLPGVSRVANDLPVPTCRRLYPGGTAAGSSRSPEAATAAFPAIGPGRLPQHVVSRPQWRSLVLRPADSPSRLKRPSTPKASASSLPCSPLRLLPAGATRAGWDLHPLKIAACRGAPVSTVCYRRPGQASVESGSGAVVEVGRACGWPFRLPVPEYPTMPRFHSPLIEPDVRISRIRLSDQDSCVCPQDAVRSPFEPQQP